MATPMPLAYRDHRVTERTELDGHASDRGTMRSVRCSPPRDRLRVPPHTTTNIAEVTWTSIARLAEARIRRARLRASGADARCRPRRPDLSVESEVPDGERTRRRIRRPRIHRRPLLRRPIHRRRIHRPRTRLPCRHRDLVPALQVPTRRPVRTPAGLPVR